MKAYFWIIIDFFITLPFWLLGYTYNAIRIAFNAGRDEYFRNLQLMAAEAKRQLGK